MEITLRKANAVQASINELLKENIPVSTVEVDEFVSVNDTLTAAKAQFETQVQLRSRLLDALYEIRKNVSQVNATLQVDNLLADMARLEREIEFNSALARLTPRAPLSAIDAKVQKIASLSESAYYGPKTVSTSVINQDEVDSYRKAVKTLKKQKQKLQDKLLELNVGNTITLSAEAVTVLTEQDIL